QAALGDHRPRTLAKASFLGAVSSSCSYAASALAKSLFARGADFTASMIFMIASTNLVVELGIVIWLLLGWQFAAAEFIGGAIMIVLLGLVLPRVIARRWTDGSRILVEPAKRRAGAVSGPHQLRLFDRECAHRGCTLAGRNQLRWRDLLHLRRPHHAAAALHLPQVLRHRDHAAAARGLLVRHERRFTCHRVPRESRAPDAHGWQSHRPAHARGSELHNRAQRRRGDRLRRPVLAL